MAQNNILINPLLGGSLSKEVTGPRPTTPSVSPLPNPFPPPTDAPITPNGPIGPLPPIGTPPGGPFPPRIGIPIPPRILGPIDDCQQSVTICGLNPGSRVIVLVNGFVKWSGFANGSSLEAFVCSLKVGDLVQPFEMFTDPWLGQIPLLGAGLRVVSHDTTSVLTQHYNSARTGWFPYETQLTPDQLPNLKQLFTMPFNADILGPIYAQPLYLHHQYFPGDGRAHNALYVATEDDYVYAFDADTPQTPLWIRDLCPERDQPNGQRPFLPDDASFGQGETSTFISPTSGVTGTPVIDCGGCNCDCSGSSNSANPCATPTMYVVSKSVGVTDGIVHHYLHALDVTTGEERLNSPVEIKGQVIGTGGTIDSFGRGNDGKSTVFFLPQWHTNRAALLLVNKTVYVSFGSPGDLNPDNYHGWIMAYDAQTLQQTAVFCSSPDTFTWTNPFTNTEQTLKGMGGIWMSGMGLASDGEFVYCAVGNGPFNAPGGVDYGNSILKLTLGLGVDSFFTPSNWKSQLATDTEIGSGGVSLIPNSNLLTVCGKDANIFLLDRNNLGGLGSGPNNLPPSAADNPHAVFSLILNTVNEAGVWGNPAYYENASGDKMLYYCGSGGPLQSFVLKNNQLSLKDQSPASLDWPGTGGSTPIVTSSQQSNGILWAIVRPDTNLNISPQFPVTLRLRGFNANNLADTINFFEAECGQWISPGAPFIDPTVINGKVYVASGHHVTVFGLVPGKAADDCSQ